MSIDDQEPDGTGVIPDIWDRLEQTGETGKAYAAFLIYRNLPPMGRSARKVVPLAYGPDYTEDHPKFRSKWEVCQKWSVQHAWVARALEWDKHQAAEQAAWDVNQIRSMRERHAEIATDALDKVRNLLDDARDWKPADIVRLLDVAARLERDARGDNPKLSLQHSGPDGGPIRTELQTTSGTPGNDTLREVVHILVEAKAFEDATEGVKEAVDAYIAGTGTDSPPD